MVVCCREYSEASGGWSTDLQVTYIHTLSNLRLYYTLHTFLTPPPPWKGGGVSKVSNIHTYYTISYFTWFLQRESARDPWPKWEDPWPLPFVCFPWRDLWREWVCLWRECVWLKWNGCPESSRDSFGKIWTRFALSLLRNPIENPHFLRWSVWCVMRRRSWF